MKRRIFVSLVCIILFIIIAGVLILFSLKFKSKKGTLYVNNQVITNKNVTIYRKYAEIPFTAVLKNLGFSVDWIDNTTAEVIWKDEKYILDLVEVSFYKVGTDNNLIIPVPGSNTFYSKVTDHDVILDELTVNNILFRIGKDVYIDIDREKIAVFVTEKE